VVPGRLHPPCQARVARREETPAGRNDQDLTGRGADRVRGRAREIWLIPFYSDNGPPLRSPHRPGARGAAWFTGAVEPVSLLVGRGLNVRQYLVEL
jgi:hypothetical protein